MADWPLATASAPLRRRAPRPVSQRRRWLGSSAAYRCCRTRPVKEICRVRGVLELVRGGLVDGDRPGSGRRVGLLTAMNRQGFRLQVSVELHVMWFSCGISVWMNGPFTVRAPQRCRHSSVPLVCAIRVRLASRASLTAWLVGAPGEVITGIRHLRTFPSISDEILPLVRRKVS